MIDEKRLIKECEERLLVGTNVIKMIEEQPKILEWIPLEKKKPENGARVLLSFKNEGQKPQLGVHREGEEDFYVPFTNHITYTSLGRVVNAWMSIPEPYTAEKCKKEDSPSWKREVLNDFMKGAYE